MDFKRGCPFRLLNGIKESKHEYNTAAICTNAANASSIKSASGHSTDYNSPAALSGPQLNKVHGLDGAKQFITQANAMYALFDDDDDVMYIKVTDANNYPVSLKRYRFHEEEEPAPQSPPEYVTKTEFEEFKKTPAETYVTQDQYKELLASIELLKEEMQNAKQSVRTQNYNSNNK